MVEYEPEKLGAVVRFHPRTLRDLFTEILNHLYPVLGSSEFATESSNRWLVYIFAIAWSVFGRLPSLVVLLSVGFGFVVVVAASSRSGISLKINSVVLFINLFIDILVVILTVSVVYALNILHNFFVSTEVLESRYNVLSHFNGLWYSPVFEHLSGLTFVFKIDTIAAIFTIMV